MYHHQAPSQSSDVLGQQQLNHPKYSNSHQNNYNNSVNIQIQNPTIQNPKIQAYLNTDAETNQKQVFSSQTSSSHQNLPDHTLKTRKCVVTLPTDNLDEVVMNIASKFKVMDVIDIIASKLQIDKHKNLFGLVFEPENQTDNQTTSHSNPNSNHNSNANSPFIYPRWLTSDKLLISDHDFIKKLPPDHTIRLHFRIKYYVRKFLELGHADCVNLYYNNARTLLLKYSCYDAMSLQCHINLAALQLQAEFGNFSSYVAQQIACFVPSMLSKNLVKSLGGQGNVSENHIISSVGEEWRASLHGIPKDQCVVRFLQTLETQCPMYGVHYLPVTDKTHRKTSSLLQSEVKNLLGISLHGIAEYTANNKYQPVNEFSWDELESLYHKDFKFTIETENTEGEKKQCIWYGPMQIISAVWNMAIHQHRFYMERYPRDGDSSASRMDVSKLLDQLHIFYQNNPNKNHKQNSSSNISTNLTRKSSNSSIEQVLPQSYHNSKNNNNSSSTISTSNFKVHNDHMFQNTYQSQNIHKSDNNTRSSMTQSKNVLHFDKTVQKFPNCHDNQNGQYNQNQFHQNQGHQNTNSQFIHNPVHSQRPDHQKLASSTSSSTSNLPSNSSKPPPPRKLPSSSSSTEILRKNIICNNDPLEHTRSLIQKRQELLDDQYLNLVDMIKRVSKIQQSITGVTPPELQRFSDAQSLAFSAPSRNTRKNPKSQPDNISTGSGNSNPSPEKHSLPENGGPALFPGEYRRTHSKSSVGSSGISGVRTPMDQKEIESYKQLLGRKDLRMKQQVKSIATTTNLDAKLKNGNSSSDYENTDLDSLVQREFILNQEILSGWNFCFSQLDKNKNWVDSFDRLNKRQARIGEHFNGVERIDEVVADSPKLCSPKVGSPLIEPSRLGSPRIGSPKTETLKIEKLKNGTLKSPKRGSTSNQAPQQTSPDSKIVTDSKFPFDSLQNQEKSEIKAVPPRFKTAQVRNIPKAAGLTVKPISNSQDQMYQIMMRKNSDSNVLEGHELPEKNDKESVNSDDTVAIWERHERKFGGPVSTNYQSNYTAGGRTFQLNLSDVNMNINQNSNSNSNNNNNNNNRYNKSNNLNSSSVLPDDITPIHLKKFVDRMRVSRSNSKSTNTSMSDSENACEIQTDPDDVTNTSTLQRNRDSKRWNKSNTEVVGNILSNVRGSPMSGTQISDTFDVGSNVSSNRSNSSSPNKKVWSTQNESGTLV